MNYATRYSSTTKLLSIVALLCLTLNACKKGSEEKKQVKLVSKITKTSNGITTVNTFIYDGKNRLIEVKGAEPRIYQYVGDDLVVAKVQGTTRTVTYSNGVPVSATLVSTQTSSTGTYIVANGRVTKSTSNAGGFFIQFGYTDNNLTTTADMFSTSTFVFGPDKSPYYNSRFKYVLDYNDVEYFSENGLTESYYSASPRMGSTFSYLRDVDGYPKSAVEKRNKPNQADAFNYTDITYEYEMHDVAE